MIETEAHAMRVKAERKSWKKRTAEGDLSRACLHSLSCLSSCRAPAMQTTVMYGFYTVVSIFLFLYGCSEIKL